MNDNDSLTVIAKITSIVIGTLSFLLVNNKFVLGKGEAQCRLIKKDLNLHIQSYKEDRKEMVKSFEKAVEKSEERLKEHMTLLIKADKADSFDQSGRR